MSSSHQFAIMSLQSIEENYHEVCHSYLSYLAISAIFLERALNLMQLVRSNNSQKPETDNLLMDSFQISIT